MRVRILTSVGGWPVGAIVDVLELDTALAWIASGDAEPFEPLETATAAAPETTMRAPTKKGRK